MTIKNFFLFKIIEISEISTKSFTLKFSKADMILVRGAKEFQASIRRFLEGFVLDIIQ